MFFPPWSSTTGTFLSKRGSTISFCPCNENSASSAEHRASAIEIRTNMTTFWNPEEINMKNYEKLEKILKDRILSKISAQPPAQPCLPSPHCSPLRHAAGRTWNSKVTRNADATSERTASQHAELSTSQWPNHDHPWDTAWAKAHNSEAQVLMSNKLRNLT